MSAGRAPRGEQPHRGIAAARDAMAQHRHQRHDPRAAADQQQRAARRRVPDEVAADRAAQLELVAGPELVDEVRRDLAVVEPLDGEHERSILGRRGDRVAALRLVAVLGGQADVDVLTCPVARSSRGAQHEALDPRRLLDRLDDARRAARSVARVPLLEPWVAVVVVAVALPEARLVVVAQLQPAHPLRALPEVEVRHEQPRRAAVLGLERLAVVAVRDPGLAARDVLQREVRRVAAVAEGDHELGRRSRRPRAACRPRRPPSACRASTTSSRSGCPS